MWGLLECLILYFKKKKWIVPLFILILVALGYILFVFYQNLAIFHNTSQLQKQTVGIVEPVSKNVKFNRIPPTNNLLNNQTPHSPKRISEEHIVNDNVANAENIRNFTRFDELVQEELAEYGGLFSKNLAYKIAENLKRGETNLEDLEKTIQEELDSNATDEQKSDIKNKIINVVKKIAIEQSKIDNLNNINKSQGAGE